MVPEDQLVQKVEQATSIDFRYKFAKININGRPSLDLVVVIKRKSESFCSRIYNSFNLLKQNDKKLFQRKL